MGNFSLGENFGVKTSWGNFAYYVGCNFSVLSKTFFFYSNIFLSKRRYWSRNACYAIALKDFFTMIQVFVYIWKTRFGGIQFCTSTLQLQKGKISFLRVFLPLKYLNKLKMLVTKITTVLKVFLNYRLRDRHQILL